MKYALEVYVCVEDRKGNMPARFEWQQMRPSGGNPYRWDTRREAEVMATITYSNDPTVVRIVEVEG